MIVMACYTNKGPKAMNGEEKDVRFKKKEEARLASVSFLLSPPTPNIPFSLFREDHAEA